MGFKSNMKIFYFWFLLVIWILSGCQSGKKIIDEYGTKTPFISKINIRSNLEFLASDELEGRETGTRGARVAARFLSSRLQEYGVMPFHERGYFQEFLLQGISIDKNSGLALLSEDGRILEEFVYDRDFVGYSKYAVEMDTTLELLFVGYGITAMDYDYDDYSSIDAQGKIVLIQYGEPGGEDQNFFEGKEESPYATTLNKIMTAKNHGAVAAIITSKREKEYGWDNIKAYMNKKILKLPGSGQNKSGNDFPVLIINENTMRQILKHGEYSFSQLQSYFKDGEELPKFKFKSPINISLKICREDSITARNVIGKSVGMDSVLKHEYVVLSAHYDHIGYSHAGVFNGADDNASGTTAVLEIAKVLAFIKQNKRSMLFIFHTGEEKGLLGSKYMTENSNLMDSIIACINLDMVGRGQADSIYAIGSDRMSIKFHDLVDVVDKESMNLHISYKLNGADEPERLYYRSDQYSYAKKNIPVVFFFDNDMEDYHKTSDDADKINYHKIAQVAELVCHLALRVANVDKRFEKDELVSR